MTWTYGGSPSTSTRDELRLLVGDTDTNDQLLTDAEVSYFLAKNSSVRLASAMACRAIVAKLSRQVDFSLGELSKSLSQKVKHFTQLAKELEAEAGRYSFSSTTPSVGVLTDTGTMPNDYKVTDESEPLWSLDRANDAPDEIRGVDIDE